METGGSSAFSHPQRTERARQTSHTRAAGLAFKARMKVYMVARRWYPVGLEPAGMANWACNFLEGAYGDCQVDRERVNTPGPGKPLGLMIQ